MNEIETLRYCLLVPTGTFRFRKNFGNVPSLIIYSRIPLSRKFLEAGKKKRRFPSYRHFSTYGNFLI